MDKEQTHKGGGRALGTCVGMVWWASRAPGKQAEASTAQQQQHRNATSRNVMVCMHMGAWASSEGETRSFSMSRVEEARGRGACCRSGDERHQKTNPTALGYAKESMLNSTFPKAFFQVDLPTTFRGHFGRNAREASDLDAGRASFEARSLWRLWLLQPLISCAASGPSSKASEKPAMYRCTAEATAVGTFVLLEAGSGAAPAGT